MNTTSNCGSQGSRQNRFKARIYSLIQLKQYFLQFFFSTRKHLEKFGSKLLLVFFNKNIQFYTMKPLCLSRSTKLNFVRKRIVEQGGKNSLEALDICIKVPFPNVYLMLRALAVQTMNERFFSTLRHLKTYLSQIYCDVEINAHRIFG